MIDEKELIKEIKSCKTRSELDEMREKERHDLVFCKLNEDITTDLREFLVWNLRELQRRFEAL